jgi:hypothetical protein
MSGAFKNYTPITDIEREALTRLAEAGEYRIHVVGWGWVNTPRVLIGDLRLGLQFRMTFNAPAVPVPVHYFDLELRTGSGMVLFRERQKAVYAGKPLLVGAGLFLDMAWDIAINTIDPKVVKAIVPGALGLTSRNIDKDTGAVTMFGNQRLTAKERATIANIRRMEAASRLDSAEQIRKATALAEEAVRTGKVRVKK